MWPRHWGLDRDPFAEGDSPYLSLPSHDKAVARLVDSIERAQRFTALFAEAGLGKTIVLRRAIERSRAPRRRSVLVHAPSDGQQLLGLFADGLGLPFSTGSDRATVWRALARSIRTASLEGTHIVLAVDGWDEEPSLATMQDVTALMNVGRSHAPPISFVRVGRGPSRDRTEWFDAGPLPIGLERLTRSEAETYVEAKLSIAGGSQRIFTPRALTRLHSWSEGVPRKIDQVATSCLMVGAAEGLEMVTPDVVDGVAPRNFMELNLALTAR